MAEHALMAFHPDGITLSVCDLLPLKKIEPKVKWAPKYKKIVSSIREIGVIEPIVVYPQDAQAGAYSILDGHLRVEALKDLEVDRVLCLIAKDDEGYSYNQWVNRLTAIQEHLMIKRALANGVPAKRLAETLNVNVSRIHLKQNLLNGICKEVIELLNAKNVSQETLNQMKKVHPVRQLEMAELMISQNNYSANYAKAIVIATPRDKLVEPKKGKNVKGISAEDMARMEREMESLTRDFKMQEDTYGQTVLDLVVARGYLNKVLKNNRIARFLSQHYTEFLEQFQKVVAATSLEGTAQS